MICIKKKLLLLLLPLVFGNCKQQVPKQEKIVEPESTDATDTIQDVLIDIPKVDLEGIADTTFIRLADYSDDFAYDLRYATTNNFLKAKVYECAECYTRTKTAKALIKANQVFMKQGVKIKFFDCYRPNSVQYLMWEIVPNSQYVANPVKGSIHNKGGAVDITLVTLDGIELDMGTDFDYFGKKAYHDATELPEKVLQNRLLLKETMEKFGFWSIRTEWWHYNLSAATNDPIANFTWPCDL